MVLWPYNNHTTQVSGVVRMVIKVRAAARSMGQKRLNSLQFTRCSKGNPRFSWLILVRWLPWTKAGAGQTCETTAPKADALVLLFFSWLHHRLVAYYLADTPTDTPAVWHGWISRFRWFTGKNYSIWDTSAGYITFVSGCYLNTCWPHASAPLDCIFVKSSLIGIVLLFKQLKSTSTNPYKHGACAPIAVTCMQYCIPHMHEHISFCCRIFYIVKFGKGFAWLPA